MLGPSNVHHQSYLGGIFNLLAVKTTVIKTDYSPDGGHVSIWSQPCCICPIYIFGNKIIRSLYFYSPYIISDSEEREVSSPNRLKLEIKIQTYFACRFNENNKIPNFMGKKITLEIVILLLIC